MTTLAGLDVSHWQSGINLAATGLDFAIVKATEGTDYVDSTCNGFISQAKKAGMKYGVYHFYQGGGASEAKFFLDQVAGYVGDALLVLDFETHTSDVAGAKAWLDYVYDATGVRAAIYMNRSVLTSNNWSSVAKDYPLWFARYASETGSISPWDNLTLWQYTSTGHAPGYSGSLDLDHFYGSRSTWDTLATGKATDPEPEPTEDEMKYVGYSTGKDFAVSPNTWHYIRLNSDGDLSIVTRGEQTTLFDAIVHLTLTGLPEGKQAEVQFVGVDVKSGQTTQVIQTWPSVEITGTPGKTKVGFSQIGELSKPADGWSRRLRARIYVWDEDVVIIDTAARALHQP